MTIAIPTIGTRVSVSTFGQPVAIAINDHETRLTAADLITVPLGSAWVDYSPTYGNVVVNNGAVICRYKVAGKLGFFKWKFTWGSGSSASAGFWTISMPFVARDLAFTGGAYITDSGVGQRSAAVVPITTSAFAVVVASTLISSNNVPIGWSTGDEVVVSFVAELP